MGIFGVSRGDGGRSAQLTRRRPRAFGTIATASAALVLALFAPPAAHAAPEDTPAAKETVGAPTITSPQAGSFIGSARIIVTGTKAAGSEVQILAGSSRTSVCTVTNADTVFSCDVSRLPSGPAITLSAVQLSDDGPNLESTPVVVDVLAAPTIAGASPQLTSGLVQGGGYPEATITLSVGDYRWTVPAGPDGTWAYVLPRAIGSGAYSLTATQSTSFSEGRQSDSGPVKRIRLDVDPPAPPRLTSPAPGSTLSSAGTVFAGTGENEARVDVFAVTASGSDIDVCSAVVSRGSWTCSATLLPGTSTVTAFQKDAAGNVGGGSSPLTLRVAAPSSPSPTTAPKGDEPVPAPAPAPAPAEPAVPPTTPGPTVPAPTEPQPDDGATTWADATPFTSAVPSALGAADLSWLRALLLAAVAIVLLFVPARMLATTVGVRRASPHTPSLTGRNRVPTHDDPEPLVSTPGTVLSATGLVVAAGGLVLFANPVLGQPEYLRVFLASVTAIALLNLASTQVPKLLAPRLAHSATRLSLSPRLLILVAIVALFSRLLDLQPALLFGVVFTVAAVSGVRSARGLLSLFRIGTVFTFGILAWLASTLLGTPSGFADILLTEVVNIAATAGIGSAAILLIPLGSLDGRALLVWSRPAWFASAVIVLTVLFALLAPVVDVWQHSSGILVGLLIVLLFGAVGFSVWLWRRLIQPALSSD